MSSQSPLDESEGSEDSGAAVASDLSDGGGRAPVDDGRAVAGRARSDLARTASARDQASSDRDQAVSDRDQAVSDRDQASSDRDLLQGGDAARHGVSREARDRDTRERRDAARRRSATADERDAAAHERDVAASVGHQAAAAEDRDISNRDAPGGPSKLTAARRASVSAARVAAADVQQRAAAARDQAAGDRGLAARNRADADLDRDALLRELGEEMSQRETLIARLVEQAALLELAPDAIFACDVEHHITFWNHAAAITYGFTLEEAIGQQREALLGTEYPIALAEIERQVSDSGMWEGDLTQTTKAGRRITVASRWGAVRDDMGRLTGRLHVNRDQSERLAAQAEQERLRSQLQREQLGTRLVRAQRLESLGQLAGGIAHDFNNLLAIIAGHAAVVSQQLNDIRDVVDAERWRSLHADIGQIASASERAAGLTRQLLTFARQETVNPEVIDINATITEMRPLLIATLGDHITLVSALDPEIDTVRIDSGQLGQILVNLAVNSREAMPRAGRLTITTERVTYDEQQILSHGTLPAGRYVRLAVSDTGCGMPSDVTERAFDPFFTTRPPGHGTGLGLATVHGIATQAGGQVTLSSEPDVGTTITVLIPASDQQPSTPTLPTIDTITEACHGTVLLVEDEPALQAIIARVLAGAGYTVTCADSGPAALAIIDAREHTIDLLLTDISLPGLRGTELANRFTAAAPSGQVLFMSGYAGTALQGQDDHMARLLQKPFTHEQLLATVAATIASAAPGALDTT
jgi:two-component system cell cycle sensor histidine kinase/response regulator CckA